MKQCTVKPTLWAVRARNGIVYEHTIRTTRRAAAEAFIAAGTEGASQRWDTFHIDRRMTGDRLRVVKVRVELVD
jgi:hypothetical protein